MVRNPLLVHLGEWTLTSSLEGSGGTIQRLDPLAIKEIGLRCRYSCLVNSLAKGDCELLLAKASGMPSLSLDNSPSKYMGSLFLVWADQHKEVKDTDIWFLRSVHFGDNWATPVRINNNDVGKHQFTPTMAVDQTDVHIYILFYNRRDYEDEQTDVYLAYSSGNGTPF